jgi:adenylyltransferase/sulfurtransferase
MYLAAAGVGTLGVVDDDIVSLSNLQRQIIHATPDIGRRKVDSAAEQIMRSIPMSVCGACDAARCRQCDGADRRLRSGARRLRQFRNPLSGSDACFLAGKPLITAALGMFDGSLTTIRAHEKNADGEFNPTYRCLFPEPPPPGTVPACAEAGVMGALAGVLGSMMALEAIREIVGFGEGWSAAVDGGRARDAVRDAALQRDPLKPLNGDALVITDLSGIV